MSWLSLATYGSTKAKPWGAISLNRSTTRMLFLMKSLRSNRVLNFLRNRPSVRAAIPFTIPTTIIFSAPSSKAGESRHRKSSLLGIWIAPWMLASAVKKAYPISSFPMRPPLSAISNGGGTFFAASPLPKGSRLRPSFPFQSGPMAMIIGSPSSGPIIPATTWK